MSRSYLRFTPSKLAMLVAVSCTSQFVMAHDVAHLDEIKVFAVEISDTIVNTTVKQRQIQQQQARDLKDLFKGKMDVYATQAQMTRASEGVNIRGLQGNRVTTTIDNIPLPETQEAKHFMAYGSEFGRGDYVEVTALRNASVQYAGSANSLSGSVNFTTLTPQDLLKGKTYGGFIGTGYNSVDNSLYGTIGGAIEVGAYQGMLMTTLRDGDHTINKGKNGGTGDNRTEPNPSDYKSQYVLTKHNYKLNEQNTLNFGFEHLSKKVDSNLLAQTNTRIDAGSGVQLYGNTQDKISRNRFSIGHEYHNEKGFVQTARSQLYYQDSQTKNHRFRQGSNNYRQENTTSGHKIFGFNTDLMSYIDANIPHVLRYGLGYSHAKATNHLRYERPGYIGSTSGPAYFNGKPTADTTQHKFTAYLEDEIGIGSFFITPQIGLVHYRVSPTSAMSSQVDEFTPTKRSETKFTPKVSLEWRVSNEFTPYVQYSRGVRTPSPQQLTSYFFENPTYRYFDPRANRIVTGSSTIAVIGNPNLKSETADNFELGIKGKSDTIDYLLTGYYNRYKNFIDWQANSTLGCMRGCKYTSFVQYQNLDKAKVYGVTFDAKWKFYEDYYLLGGVTYMRGKAENNGVKTPINSVLPLKTKLGLGYEGEKFGANVVWSYTRAKAGKDIEQSSAYLYNPSNSYGLVDIGLYIKPIKNLTLTANINNVFDKKYWNWNDISYLALLSKASVDQGRGANGIPLAINQANADRYSAPGRNFNVGLRYEF
ncbi:TonB-dependent receptor domain-containing protein [Mannheimia granulomatis]|uniref:TonB-dependent receptor domain-containing protein n=1 Tax=Mannheimia granulomatis TaxID=85402 RepID=UPI00047B97AA|nr:TonB-dependent receptor [Mannheimia granulomatis]QLB18706.1 TonB-dependent receptor [Mannheimia granulomatis]